MISNNSDIVSVRHRFAREYAERGLAIFPVKERSKAPAIPNGFKSATRDIGQIDRWWGCETLKNSNIGCATGAPSRIVALDLDAKPDAHEILKSLEGEFERLPNTACSLTGGGGMHFYFRSEEPMPCRIGMRKGVDFKADGGYVILPGSIHESGKAYVWDEVRSSDPSGFAPIPNWLRILANGESGGKKMAETNWHKLASEGVTEGSRNDSLAKFCGHLLRKNVDAYVVRELLIAWNQTKCRPPLSAFEVERTFQSIARAEIQRRFAKEGSNGCD